MFRFHQHFNVSVVRKSIAVECVLFLLIDSGYCAVSRHVLLLITICETICQTEMATLSFWMNMKLNFDYFDQMKKRCWTKEKKRQKKKKKTWWLQLNELQINSPIWNDYSVKRCTHSYRWLNYGWKIIDFRFNWIYIYFNNFEIGFCVLNIFEHYTWQI